MRQLLAPQLDEFRSISNLVRPQSAFVPNLLWALHPSPQEMPDVWLRLRIFLGDETKSPATSFVSGSNLRASENSDPTSPR
jgi:hypothetical protein